MMVADVESIGGFVGGSVSEPLLQGGILYSVLAYMIHVDLWVQARQSRCSYAIGVCFTDEGRDEPAHPRARLGYPHISNGVVEGISSDEAWDRADEVTCVS